MPGHPTPCLFSSRRRGSRVSFGGAEHEIDNNYEILCVFDFPSIAFSILNERICPAAGNKIRQHVYIRPGLLNLFFAKNSWPVVSRSHPDIF
jgi:hypothetical protein